MSRLAVIRCTIAAMLFGASAPAAAQLTDDVPVLVLAGLLYLGAALAVAPSVIRHPPARADLRRERRRVGIAVVAGGALGPALLVAGLARTNTASASLLLNTELAATVVLAAIVFHEHLGRRLLLGVGLVTAASAVLTWEPGARFDTGALLIVAACVFWGLDNGVTAEIDRLAPEHVVAAKGVVAGGANLLLGLAITDRIGGIGGRDVLAALAIGAAGYGVSITLWVKGARELGAARGQVIFSTAPFVGAVVAWVLFDAGLTGWQVVAMALAAAGVAISLQSGHLHDHEHDELEHDHEHRHDDGHHDHEHDDHDHDHDHGHDHDHDHDRDGDASSDDVGGVRHAHLHRHRHLAHSHPHVPDLHHRHDH